MHVLLKTFLCFHGYRNGTSDWNGLIFPVHKVLSTNAFWAHVNVGVGESAFFKIVFRCHKCMSRHTWITYHLVLTHLITNLKMVVSHFQIRMVPKSHYLKSGKCCTWPSLLIFLGSHRTCSPILTYKVVALSIAIHFSHVLLSFCPVE